MNLFVCTDKSGGILFANRRVSTDSAVRKKIFDIIGQKMLFLNGYTAGQFENTEQLCVFDDFVSQMQEDDFCFIENSKANLDLFNQIFLFNWNRNYPADTFFNVGTEFEKISSQSFAGTSHKKITLTVYRRQKNERH